MRGALYIVWRREQHGKFEEEKIVGKIEKAAATPQIPRAKVNAPPSGPSSSSLSDFPDIEAPTPLASSTKSTREKWIFASKDVEGYDREGDGAEDADLEEFATTLSQPPQSTARIYHCHRRADRGM
jgi:hypothetical protein